MKLTEQEQAACDAAIQQAYRRQHKAIFSTSATRSIAIAKQYEFIFAAGLAFARHQPDAEPVSEVLLELKYAMEKFPTWPVDPLHAVAVLGEEFGELTKAVLQHTYEPKKSSLSDVRMEAIQTAAMALRFIMSLDDYSYTECPQIEQQTSPDAPYQPPDAEPTAE